MSAVRQLGDGFKNLRLDSDQFVYLAVYLCFVLDQSVELVWVFGGLDCVPCVLLGYRKDSSPFLVPLLDEVVDFFIDVPCSVKP